MTKILKRLDTRFSRYADVIEADERDTPEGARVSPSDSAQGATGKKRLKSYNSKEAAEFLQLTPKAVRDRVSSGKLAAYKPGRVWVFLEEDLIGYLKSTRLETAVSKLRTSARSVPPTLSADLGANPSWIDLYRLATTKGL